MKKTTMIKKYFIGALLLLSFIAVRGQTAVQPSGVGNESDPYQISTVENLLWISENSSEWGAAKYYVQTDSIDLYKLNNFSPIGNATNLFNGSYDGRGNPILNLTIFNAAGSDLGLFGVTGSSAVISNVNLQYFDIVGKDSIGGLVGINNGSLLNSTGRGIVSVSDSNCLTSGGLVGKNTGIIDRCNVMIYISGAGQVGGLVGENYGGVVKESYSEGKVKGSELIGGLIGNNNRIDDTQTGKVTNSYSHADVTRVQGAIGEKIGSFIGGNNSEVGYCYSTGKVIYDDTPTIQPGEKVWPERLRGINVGRLSVNLMDERFIRKMAEWGANAITVNYGYDKKLDMPNIPEAPAVPDSMVYYKNGLYVLDKLIENAAKYKMFVMIETTFILGSSDINVATGETTEENEMDERYYIEKQNELYLYLGKKYNDNPTVLGYNFISEPHSPWIVANWSSKIVLEFIETIRSVDNNTYLIIAAGLWGFPDFGKKSPRISAPVNDPANKTIYSIHSYAPHNYTHQGIGSRPSGLVYPGMLKMFSGSPLIWWGRDELQNYMQPAINFMKKYNVKMINGEFSVNRWAPNGDKWFDDQISIMEEYGIDYTVFNFGSTSWDGWNITVADNAPGGHVADGGVETNRLKVVKKYLRKNKIIELIFK